MRILVVNTIGLEYEGITSSILSYLAAMDRKGMTIDFVAVKTPNPCILSEIEKMGCSVYRLPARNQRPAAYFLELRRLIARNRYDIVHAHGNSATLFVEMLAARMGGCRLRIAHSHSTFCEHPVFDRLLRTLFYLCYTDALACGEGAGHWLFSGRPFLVIPNGKDINKFAFDPQARMEYRKKYGLEKKIVIGHVGNFIRLKNHFFLIDAFRELAATDCTYQLVLIGDGPLRPEIEHRIWEYGLQERVLLAGRTHDVPHFLQAMDIMALPSLYEGLPNVVLEWQIAGLPCIVSDKVTSECKVTELVSFVPLEDGPAAWAEVFKKIKIPDRSAIDQQVRAKMAEAGYDIRENVKLLKAHYQQMIKAERRRRSEYLQDNEQKSNMC